VRAPERRTPRNHSGLAGDYLGEIEDSSPTKNQALAALRHFFDGLVTRHAVALNPFASVRGVRHIVGEGSTPEISVEQARKLLRSVARLRLGDLRNLGEHRGLRFREKGGELREIPVRHDLDVWLRDYLAAASIVGQNHKAPLFRAAAGKRRQLTNAAYAAHSMRQMLKRRLQDWPAGTIFAAQLPRRGGH
jgi:site-specific recombinase XerC